MRYFCVLLVRLNSSFSSQDEKQPWLLPPTKLVFLAATVRSSAEASAAVETLNPALICWPKRKNRSHLVIRHFRLRNSSFTSLFLFLFLLRSSATKRKTFTLQLCIHHCKRQTLTWWRKYFIQVHLNQRLLH